MQYKAKTIDPYSYAWQTEQNRARVDSMRERVSAHDADSNKMERQAKGECRVCFYIDTSRIGGAALSERPCSLCGARLTSGNTNVDILCWDCATERGVCKHCGGDMEGKKRRNVNLAVRERTAP